MQYSIDIEKKLSEYKTKFVAPDPENGIPSYTQHPDVLGAWIADSLNYIYQLGQLERKHIL